MAQLLVDVTPFKPTLREAKGRPGVFEVEGVMQRATAENQNGRVYSKALLQREAKKYMEEFVKRGNAFGELDHPETPVVSLKNASHIVKDLYWNGNDLMGKVELLNTPSGNIVKEIISSVDLYRGNAPLRDDLTLLAFSLEDPTQATENLAISGESKG